MKTFLSITTLLLALSTNAFADFSDVLKDSANPYETLKAAYTNAPRAATYDDIDWVTDYSKNWADCLAYKSKDEQVSDNLAVVKWTKVVPGNGPLFPGSTQNIVTLVALTGTSNPAPFGNENALSGDFVVTNDTQENALSVNITDINTIQLFKSDNSSIFFKIKDTTNKQAPAYGYCWKK